METYFAKSLFGGQFSQVAWVVKDIQATEKFFKEVIGVRDFVKLENLSAQSLQGTHYGKPAEFSFHLYLGYSGDSMIELIQPISGQSIFQEYIDKNPSGGVQHVAYSVPVADLEKAVSELTGKGCPVITTLNLPVAHVVFFDTYNDLGVVTEIIGLTEAGVPFVQDLKNRAS